MGYKIVELQGLRCIAIISVLLYHVWPKVFVNGFLGVDVFFVISGFIMALILLPTDSLKTSFLSTTLNFYHRRIYRILPLYLLNIFISILIIPPISYSSTMIGIFQQVFSVLTFTKNFVNVSKFLNYFDNATSIDMFTHYWSLCVEMQFYAMAPFLLYLSKRLPLLINLFLFWPILIGVSVGLIFYEIIKFGPRGSMFAFNMLPTRLYEFAAGFIAFYVQEFIAKYFSEQKILLRIRNFLYHFIVINFLSVALVLLVLWPTKLNEFISKPATVILTAAIISFIGRETKGKAELQLSILANEAAVFVGNASYSLYIFHWIFIIIFKAMMEEMPSNRNIIFVLCFITGIAVHEFIEKPICKTRMEPKKFLLWVAISYLLIGTVACRIDNPRVTSKRAKNIFHNQSYHIANPTEWANLASTITPDISVELAAYSGEIRCDHNKWSEWPKTIKEAWTYGSELTGSGNLSILVIGNSHAECAIPGIQQAMDGIYSKLSFVAIAGVTPFEGFAYSGAWFVFQKAVLHYKPDIIFLMFKYQKDFEDPITDNNWHTMKVQEMITFLSNHSKAVFISGMHFEIPHFYSIKFTEMIYNYGWIKDLKVSRDEIESCHVVSSRRWKAIKCEKCIFINILDGFCKNNWCSPYDVIKKVPLIFDSDHVTIFGSHLLSKNIKENFSKMYQLLLS